jgi:hypothetical protein
MALACAVQAAQAAEAGKIIFVAGKANVAEQPAVDGAAVQEGQMLSTGADGFLYVKTVDSGLFILRPNTQARIVTYHVDERNPANTRVKFELLSGVARSRSGNAVKQARQNFRFNTPVAAIGVRGTDFTVFTDSETSRVSVISGAIVMSGFTGACSANGAGPCEGGASRELSAAQRGLLLQVKRGQPAPQLLQSSPLSPDQVSPPRADEPLAHGAGAGGGASAGQPNLDAQKTLDLAKVIDQTLPPPVVVTPTPTPVEAGLALPERDIVWGRWQVVAGTPPKFILSIAQEQSELVALNGNFALLRGPGSDNYVAPVNGSIGFQLRDGEAFVYTDFTPTYRIATPATLSNGTLNVDFGSKSFATGFDMTTTAETIKLQGGGAVGADGRLYGDAAGGRAGYINIQGLLSKQNGGSAAYIFDGRLDEKRTVNGVTYWERLPH